MTDNSATAFGALMSLQFGPHILLLPITGFAAALVGIYYLVKYRKTLVQA